LIMVMLLGSQDPIMDGLSTRPGHVMIKLNLY